MKTKDEYRMEIVFNDERIKTDGLDVEAYHTEINRIFTGCGLVKKDDGLYYSSFKSTHNGNPSSFTRFGAAIMSYQSAKWFNIEHLELCELYGKDEDDDESEYWSAGDFIEAYHKYEDKPKNKYHYRSKVVNV
jgi:hypothetical protein